MEFDLVSIEKGRKEDGKAGRQKEVERGRLSYCTHQYFSEVMADKISKK